MRKWIIGLLLAGLFFGVLLMANMPGEEQVVEREEAIPEEAVKVKPNGDLLPPVLHSSEYETPVPVYGRMNTAGGEDSPFISPGGDILFFFFTPKVSVPPEEQVTDGVTGIYASEKVDGEWSKPERLMLQDQGCLALDGAPFLINDTLWFCSAREGYEGVRLFTAERVNEKWQNWQYAGDKLNLDYEVGELHITSDGSELYFHSDRAQGKGQYDIWVSEKVDGEWWEPDNVEAVNTDQNEGWPFISQDGKEMWFTRHHQGSPAIFRSKSRDGKWGEPELILSQFAAEPTLDDDGNIYFAHHFFKDGKMIESDIYVSFRKSS